jgi:hypothetical protein
MVGMRVEKMDALMVAWKVGRKAAQLDVAKVDWTAG